MPRPPASRIRAHAPVLALLALAALVAALPAAADQQAPPAAPAGATLVLQLWDGAEPLSGVQVATDHDLDAVALTDERGVARLEGVLPGERVLALRGGEPARLLRVPVTVHDAIPRFLGLVTADWTAGRAEARLLLPGFEGHDADVVVDRLDHLGRRDLLEAFERRIEPATAEVEAAYLAARDAGAALEAATPATGGAQPVAQAPARRALDPAPADRRAAGGFVPALPAHVEPVQVDGPEVLAAETAEQQAGRELLEVLGLVRDGRWAGPTAEISAALDDLLLDPARRAQADGIPMLRALGMTEDQLALVIAELHRQGLLSGDDRDAIVADLGLSLTLPGLDREDVAGTLRHRDRLHGGASSGDSSDGGLREVAPDLRSAPPVVQSTLGGGVSWGGSLPGALPTTMVAEAEPNNTQATCTSLGALTAAETPATGALTPAGDVDYYCFPLNCGDVLAVREQTATSTEQLELYGPDGVLIFADDTIPTATTVGQATRWRAETTGTYRLAYRRQSATVTTAAYDLRLWKTAGSCPGGEPSFNDTAEPNGSAATCEPLATTFTPFDALITPLGDEDFYCVTAPGPDFVLEVQASTLAAFGADGLVTDQASVQIEVWDPSNAVIHTGGVNSTAVQAVQLTAPGVYKIRVRGATTVAAGTPPFDNSLDELTGPYRIAARLLGVEPDAFEPGDGTRATCTAIPSDGTPVVGHTLHVGDEDWFCIAGVPCNATVAVTFTPTAPAPILLEGHVQLWGAAAPNRPNNSQNPGASYQASDPAGTAGGQAFTLTVPNAAAGDWRLRVKAATSAATTGEQIGEYTITVTVTPGPADARCDGDEPNDPATCTPLVADGTWLEDRWIWPNFDNDNYCVDLACGETLVVEVRPSSPVADLNNDLVEVELFHASDLSTSLRTVTGTFDETIRYTATTAAEAGPHVVRVWGDTLFSSSTDFMPIGATEVSDYDIRATVISESCPVPEASESNDTAATCDRSLPLDGTPVAGSIAPVTDVDVYCVDLACGENLSVTVTPLGGLMALIQIRDAVTPTPANPTFIWASATAVEPGEALTLDLPNLPAGEYRITIDGVVQTGGGYTIAVDTEQGVCVVDPVEAASPADTLATCHIVGIPFDGSPVTITRAIEDIGDRDVECFLIDCGDGVEVTVTPTDPGTRLEAVAQWFDSFQNDVIESAWRLPLGGDTVSVTSGALTAGVHYVEIRDRLARAIGTYDLTLRRIPQAFPCGDADDDTPATCRPIAFGEEVVDSLLELTDLDHYCFEADCGDTITLTMDPVGLTVPGDLDAGIDRLPEGTFITFGFSSGDVCVAGATNTTSHCGTWFQFVAERPGQYVVNISPPLTTFPSSTGYLGQYRLRIDRTPPVRPETVVTTTELPAATRYEAQLLDADHDYQLFVGSEPLEDISAVGVAPLVDDDKAFMAALPFDFEFYGVPRETVMISTEGYMTFGEEGGDRINDCPIPASGNPNGALYVFWDDLDVDVSGAYDARIYTATLGTAPDRRFVVQWHRMPMFAFPATGSEHTFQAILHEGTHVIEYRYGAMQGDADSDGGSATIGIENDDASSAVLYGCSDGSPIRGPEFEPVVEGLSLLFAPEETPFPADDSKCYSMAVDTAPFIEISGTGTLHSIPNDGNAVIILPIQLPFFGNFETVAWASNNGFLSFGVPPAGTASSTNDCITGTLGLPDASTPSDGMIAPYWDDMGPAQVYTQLFGVPGSGSAFFVVEWKNVPRVTNSGSHTFEAILHESGVIEFRYDQLGTSITNDLGGNQTVGLESRGSTNGIGYQCNRVPDVHGLLYPGLRITFSPPAQPRFTWREPSTGDVQGAGDVYDHALDGTCELELLVQANDPLRCCPYTEVVPLEVPDRVPPVITTQPAFGDAGCQFLWPPNHGYADFSLAETGIVATDACGQLTYRFSSSSWSSQPEDASGIGDGGSVDDIMISPDGQTISLRAERSGSCGPLDRTYTLYVEVSDGTNVVLSEPFSVCVYHDRGHQPPGPYRRAEAGSDSDDVRPGWTEGGYGVDCGGGCSFGCDPTQIR